MTHKRIQWLDFSKGFVIFLVVLYHTCIMGKSNPLIALFSNIILTFMMPLFFAISGYLYKPTNTLKKFFIMLYKKCTSLLIPYCIFTVILVVLHVVINGKLSLQHNVLSYLSIHPITYLWFLYSLFFIFIIVGILDLLQINNYYQIIIAGLFMCIQFHASWTISSGGNINPIRGIFGYVICFLLGRIIHKLQLDTKITKYLTNYNYMFILIIIFILLLIYQFHLKGVYYNTDLMTYDDFLAKIFGIPVFFSIFMNLHHTKFFEYFDKYGKYTLIIYLVHIPVLKIFGKIITFNQIYSTDFAPVVILFITILVWYISIIIYYVSKKLAVVNFIFYPRKYLNKLFRIK